MMTRPTTAEALGDTGETASYALDWYRRVVQGKHGKKRKAVATASAA